ncbi:hypothetical protein B0H63DRAFT_22911 [Podospora didyma]|uniref:Uncharacterized protein n=1 Tax=Podospora didyma TaxID=330526 RepID=A0AAE0U7U4_9PEZI|nr:hypothetical protein B0H63DRAFT_22911 [Podospora didyma]
MARPTKSVSSATTSSWSPQFIGGTRIPRQFIQVPKDQQVLLDRQDAWSLGGGIFPNVPAKVLEVLRESHSRVSVLSSPEKEPLSSPTTASEADDDNSEDTGTPIPWTPSPSRNARQPAPAQQVRSPAPLLHCRQPPSTHQAWPAATVQHIRSHPPIPQAQSPVPAQQAQSSPTAQHVQFPSPNPHARTQTLENPSPAVRTQVQLLGNQQQRRPDFKALSRTTFLSEPPPSSSFSSDTELELEVPRAITDVLKPVARSHPVPEPTPPSAQIIIPSTYSEHENTPKEQPKRQRRMKAIGNKLESPEPEDRNRSSMQLVQVSPLSVLSPSTIVSTSASFTAPFPNGLPISASASSAASFPNGLPVMPIDAVSMNDPHLDQPVFFAVDSSGNLPRNGPPSQVPHLFFRCQYPDFVANLNDFLRGVMVVQDIRDRMALPEFLFDDVVRVFCSDYLEYIGSNPDGPLLSAQQFYNEKIPYPLYTKRILTKKSIDDVLKQYPNEIRSLRNEVRHISPKAAVRIETQQHTLPITTDQGSSKPSSPAAINTTSQEPIVHGELESDPIDVAETPIVTTSYRSISTSRPRSSEPLGLFQDTARPAGVLKHKNPASRLLTGQASVCSPSIGRPKSLPRESINDTPLRAIPNYRSSKPSDTIPSTVAPIPLDNPGNASDSALDTIPETALKPRLSTRLSIESSGSEARIEPKKRKKRPARDPLVAREKRLMAHFEQQRLVKERLSSTAPGSSAPR